MRDRLSIENSLSIGLIGWHEFKPDDNTILYIGDKNDALFCALNSYGRRIDCKALAETLDSSWEQRRFQYYDFIVCVEKIEQFHAPIDALRHWKSLLRPNGKLFLGMNNRLGLRYFCGDRDIYTGRNFDGIENYRHVGGNLLGRMYSQAEISRMLQESGWDHFRFYSVLSDLRNPAFIYAKDYLPNEELANRLFPTYYSPNTVFLHEEEMETDLAENGLFHAMANAYLIECSLSGFFSDVLHVTCSTERGKENAFFTIIHRSGQVEKRAIYPEGRERLRHLADNMEALRQRGVPVIDGRMEHDSYVMPHIQAPLGHIYLKQLMRRDTDKFVEAMDSIRETILQSSEIIVPDKRDGEGPILAHGYWDMVPLNSFYVNGEFVFFDQEFSLSPCPANFVIHRMVNVFYYKNSEAERILPLSILLERYDLNRCHNKWIQMDTECMANLRQEKALAEA